LIHLLKKDFLLLKKYFILILFIYFLMFIFLFSKISNISIVFAIITSISEYFIYSTLTSIEEKDKAYKYLSITPYGRNAIIIGKYILVECVFIFSLLICFFIEILSLSTTQFIIHALNLTHIGLSLLLINLLFAILIPVECIMGYDKSKYILMILFIIIPTWGLGILSNLFSYLKIDINNISKILTNKNYIIDILYYLLSLIIITISSYISIFLYKSKDL
jgi:hypothetical protein